MPELLHVPLQFFAAKKKEPEPEEIDEDLDDEPEEKTKLKESEDMPKWAKDLQTNLANLLKPNEPLTKEKTAEIPVPTKPKVKEEEEDHQEAPPAKKQSFLNWLM